jgi:hypothetical protein
MPTERIGIAHGEMMGGVITRHQIGMPGAISSESALRSRKCLVGDNFSLSARLSFFSKELE